MKDKAKMTTIEAAMTALEQQRLREETLREQEAEERRLRKQVKRTKKYRLTHSGAIALGVSVGLLLLFVLWQLSEAKAYLDDEVLMADLMVRADAAEEADIHMSIQQTAYYRTRMMADQSKSKDLQLKYAALAAQAQKKATQQSVWTTYANQKAKSRPVLIVSVSAARLLYTPSVNVTVKNSTKVSNAAIPTSIAYRAFDTEKLRRYLVQKGSKLAEPMYFNAILQTGQGHNIDPRFLFAITGQEQSLVPKNHAQAEKIANNPFNVYHSWMEYNTTIFNAADIACNTISNRMAKWNGRGDPIDFINETYAEDPNWAAGVRKYYQMILEATR